MQHTLETTHFAVALPRIESALGKLPPVAQGILEDVFANKQISTAGILRLIPREKKSGMMFTSTMTLLTQIFGEYGVIVKYVANQSVSYQEENKLGIKANPRTVIKTQSLPRSLLWSEKKSEQKRAVSTTNESVDFNELERFVKVHYGGNETRENPDTLFPEINWYIERVKHHKILPKEVAYKLIKEAQEGNVYSRNTLIMHNQRLVLSIASRHKRRLGYDISALEFEDILQEGTLGLFRAIEKFDMSLNLSFSTYATWWVDQHVNRAMDDHRLTVRLPVHVHDKLSKFRKIFALMEIRSEGRPDFGELAEKMDVKISEVFYLDKLNFTQNSVSIDTPHYVVDEGEASDLSDLIADTRDITAIQIVDRKILKEKIRKCLKMNLSIKEFQIIDKRFGLSTNKPMKLQEIGTEFGVTRERIRQIEVVAMEKIRNDESLREFAEEYLETHFTAPQPDNQIKDPAEGFETAKKRAKLIDPRLSQSIVNLTVSVVGKFCGISDEQIFSETRKEEVVEARHIAMYILREHYKMSLSEIARKFNEMDHTSVRHACLKIQGLLEKKLGLATDIKFLTELLDSYKEMLSRSN
jgi:RNA polymerase primary sigma factor